MQSLPQELFAIRAIPNTYLGVNYYHMRRYQHWSAALSKLQGGHETYYEQSDPGHPGNYERSIQVLAK